MNYTLDYFSYYTGIENELAIYLIDSQIFDCQLAVYFNDYRLKKLFDNPAVNLFICAVF